MASSRRHSSAKWEKNNPSTRFGKDKVVDAREVDEGLVGSRVRVWWPLDHKFYEGVVQSYNSTKKTHRVLYDDGDLETLKMNKEKWEIIEEDTHKAKEEESAKESSDASPEPKSEEKSDVKKGEEAEMVSKPETESNGDLGDIGGKIVAEASRMSERFNKENGKEKKIAKSNNQKLKRASSSSSEAVTEKAKKPKTSPEMIKNNNNDEDESSDDDNKPLVYFLRKSPEAKKALKKKMKRKEKKEANSAKEVEVAEETS